MPAQHMLTTIAKQMDTGTPEVSIVPAVQMSCHSERRLAMAEFAMTISSAPNRRVAPSPPMRMTEYICFIDSGKRSPAASIVIQKI